MRAKIQMNYFKQRLGLLRDTAACSRGLELGNLKGSFQPFCFYNSVLYTDILQAVL